MTSDVIAGHRNAVWKSRLPSDVMAGHRNAVWKGHLPIRVGKLPSGAWVGDRAAKACAQSMRAPGGPARRSGCRAWGASPAVRAPAARPLPPRRPWQGECPQAPERGLPRPADTGRRRVRLASAIRQVDPSPGWAAIVPSASPGRTPSPGWAAIVPSASPGRTPSPGWGAIVPSASPRRTPSPGWGVILASAHHPLCALWQSILSPGPAGARCVLPHPKAGRVPAPPADGGAPGAGGPGRRVDPQARAPLPPGTAGHPLASAMREQRMPIPRMLASTLSQAVSPAGGPGTRLPFGPRALSQPVQPPPQTIPAVRRSLRLRAVS